MKNVLFNRTFHPVGHGAFFSESIRLDNGDYFNVVYDCGSIATNLARTAVEKYNHKRNHIDLIFISHFDYDHINGLKFLAEKKLVDNKTYLFIPYYHPVLHQLRGTEQDDKTYYSGIEEMFRLLQRNRVRIVMVEAVESRKETYYEPRVIPWRYLEDYEERNINGINSFTIQSGTRITIGGARWNEIWNYVPFNYGITIEQIDKITNLLKEDPLKLIDDQGLIKSEETINILSQPNDDPQKKALLRIYNTIGYKKMNDTSLQLLSFAGDKSATTEKEEIEEHIKSKYSFQPVVFDKHFEMLLHSASRSRFSCLYTGDTNLKKEDSIESIKSMKGDFLNDDLFIIQIPHHGSVNNYNPEIVSLAKVGFVNFKPYLNSRHCHFDKNIPLDYLRENVPLFFVTDKGVSTFGL